MSGVTRSFAGDDCRRFNDDDIAFALAWEVYAPGLCGWNVCHEVVETGEDLILVDPPLVYGDGFTIRGERNGVVVHWSGGQLRAPSVRDALLTICPLAPEALEAADKMAALPGPIR